MGYLSCYCTKRIKESGIEAIEEVFAQSGKKLCKEWVESYKIVNGLIVGVLTLITISNAIIPYIVVKLTKFEKWHSRTAELASGTLKIFILQFINSVNFYIEY